MNKLFTFVLLATFVVAESNYWGYAFFGLIALILIVPFTTPETIGTKSKK